MDGWQGTASIATGGAIAILTMMLNRRWSRDDRAEDVKRSEHEFWRTQRLQQIGDLVDVGNRNFFLGIEMTAKQSSGIDDDDPVYLRSNDLLLELGTVHARAQLVCPPGTPLAAAVDRFFLAVKELGSKGSNWKADRAEYVQARDALHTVFYQDTGVSS